MGELILLIVVGSSIWVVADAASLGARRGVRPGKNLDNGPVTWLIGCLLLWIVVFPMYLAARPQYVEAKRRRVQLASTPPAPAPLAPPAWNGRPAPVSAVDELERLADLRDNGTLTVDEFEVLKGRVLAQGG